MDSFLDKFLRWLRFGKVIGYIPKDSVVCDIGCGQPAIFLKRISNLIKYGIGFDEEAVDFSAKNYELRRQRILKDIPLADKSCDAVTMIAVLEHLTFPQEILNESFRILKTGGKLILTTPTPKARPILNFLARDLKFIDQGEIDDHKNYFDNNSVKQMLARSGFQEKNIKNYFFELLLNNLIIAQK